MILNRIPVAIPDTAPDDPRIGHLVGQRAGDRPRAVLVGFPSDEGVRRNGGRTGAADAPQAIRQALFRMTPDPRNPAFAGLIESVEDAGDVPVTGDLEWDQEVLGEVLAPYLQNGVVSIVLGGGHETAYGHFLGYVKAGLPVEILNWDAHSDVRPLKEGQAHSGSPFRQALEHPSGACRRYTVAGLQPHATATAHLDFVSGQGGRALFRDVVDAPTLTRLYDDLTGSTLVTFDLDAVDAAFAPGVSAPATGGFDPATWLAAARAAGRNAHVRSIDVCELNPRFDRDGQTARLAALTVWHVLVGLAER